MLERKRDWVPSKGLAEYLNCADYDGWTKNRGEGIRRWGMVQNKEWTLQPEFLEKLDKKISRWFNRCAILAHRRRSSSSSNTFLEGKQEQDQKPSQDPPQLIWVKGHRYRYCPEEKYNAVPPPPSMQVEAVVKKEVFLSEDVVDHREPRSLTFTKDVCVGTDDYWAGTPAAKVPCSTSAVNLTSHSQPPPPQPQPLSQIPSLLGPVPLLQRVALVPQPQPPSTPYVPPHMKQQQLVAQSSLSSSAPHQSQKQVSDMDSRVDRKEYEKAKSWTPKTEEQRNALEQAKLDIFNVLVVGKGCGLKYLIREFYRVTEENLDLSKIGIPDLRTLLVQMQDMIYLRRERYTNNIYVFPNLANNLFETVAHIGELVAEQRKDKNFMIPDDAVLYECDITELFQLPEWRQQQQQAPQQYSVPFQSSYYGNYANPNYNYSDYSNYYLGMQAGGTQDYNRYVQSVTQQLYYQTQQFYNNYGGYRQHHQGNNYYRH